LDRRAVTSNRNVLLGEGDDAMTTDLHQRLVEDLAGKRLLDNPRLRAAFQAIPASTSCPAWSTNASGLLRSPWPRLSGKTDGMRSHRPRPAPATQSAIAGFRFPPDVSVLAVRWYLRFGMSAVPSWDAAG
jgi:hypothetical protein